MIDQKELLKSALIEMLLNAVKVGCLLMILSSIGCSVTQKRVYWDTKGQSAEQFNSDAKKCHALALLTTNGEEFQHACLVNRGYELKQKTVSTPIF